MNQATKVTEPEGSTNWDDLPAEIRQEILSELLTNILADIAGYKEVEDFTEDPSLENKKVRAQCAYAFNTLHELALVNFSFGRDVELASELVFRRMISQREELVRAQADVAASIHEAASCTTAHSEPCYARMPHEKSLKLCDAGLQKFRDPSSPAGHSLRAMMLRDDNLDRARNNLTMKKDTLDAALRMFRQMGKRQIARTREAAGHVEVEGGRDASDDCGEASA